MDAKNIPELGSTWYNPLGYDDVRDFSAAAFNISGNEIPPFIPFIHACLPVFDAEVRAVRKQPLMMD